MESRQVFYVYLYLGTPLVPLRLVPLGIYYLIINFFRKNLEILSSVSRISKRSGTH